MMNSKLSYLVSTLTYHLWLLKMKTLINYFKTFSSCKGGFANKKPKKNINNWSLQPIIQSVVYLCTALNPTVSQRTCSANQVSLCPSCPSKLFLQEIVSHTNLVVSVHHSDQTLKRRWPFCLRSFVICPFRAQLLGGSLPYSLADILRQCLWKLLFINWLWEKIKTTAKE